MEQRGRLREVTPPHRLVHTEIHRGWDEDVALVTTTLDESGAHTAMTVTARYSSAEIRDVVVRSPMERGAGEAYEELAAVLAAVSPPPFTERNIP